MVETESPVSSKSPSIRESRSKRRFSKSSRNRGRSKSPRSRSRLSDVDSKDKKFTSSSLKHFLSSFGDDVVKMKLSELKSQENFGHDEYVVFGSLDCNKPIQLATPEELGIKSRWKSLLHTSIAGQRFSGSGDDQITSALKKSNESGQWVDQEGKELADLHLGRFFKFISHCSRYFSLVLFGVFALQAIEQATAPDGFGTLGFAFLGWKFFRLFRLFSTTLLIGSCLGSIIGFKRAAYSKTIVFLFIIITVSISDYLCKGLELQTLECAWYKEQLRDISSGMSLAPTHCVQSGEDSGDGSHANQISFVRSMLKTILAFVSLLLAVATNLND